MLCVLEWECRQSAQGTPPCLHKPAQAASAVHPGSGRMCWNRADLASLWLQLRWAHQPHTPAVPLIHLMLLLPWLSLFLVPAVSNQCTPTSCTSLLHTQPQGGFLPAQWRWGTSRDWKWWKRFWKGVKIRGRRGSWGFAAVCLPTGHQGWWVLQLAEGLRETQEFNFPCLWLSSVGASRH